MMDSLSMTDLDILGISEKTTLAAAGLWLFLQFIWLRKAAVNSSDFSPAMIPAFFLFAIAIPVILIAHLSPLHLLWLAVACFLLGLLAIKLPPIQFLSTLFFATLAKTGLPAATEASKTGSKSSSASKKKKRQPKQQSSTKAKGFG